MNDDATEPAGLDPLAELRAELGRRAEIDRDELADLLQTDQARRWRGGRGVPVEAYLDLFPPARGMPDLVVELVLGEVLLRRERGERPDPSEYAGRFPELADLILEHLDLDDFLEMPERLGDTGPGAAAGTARANGPAGGSMVRCFGDYEILRELGRGGMGVVYEAEQISLGRRVALKVIPRHAIRDEKQLGRFEREARAAARLHHTNIVPIFAVGEHDGTPYYVMQFIEGRGLNEVLDELIRMRRAGASPAADALRMRPVSAADVAGSLLGGRGEPGPDPASDPDPWHPGRSAGSTTSGPRTERRGGDPSNARADHRGRATYWDGVARIGIQVAEALEYAHGQGVIHRDIKPSNLLLDVRGVVWVADFGLAKADDQPDLTLTGDILGTLRYMPPEALEGKADRRGDTYSLGLTLYELLTLRPAFEPSGRLRLIERIKVEEPPRPRLVDHRIPRDLETIVLKAIAKDPRDRYPSADAMGQDLRRFLAGEPIQARRVGAAERFWQWCKRKPVVAGLTAAVFVLLAAVAGVASVGYLREAAAHGEADRQRAAAEAAEARARGQAERARAAELEMRRQWYAASINLMQPAWDSGKADRLRTLLAETEAYPERGFEWYYWQRLRHREQHTLIGHRDIVTAVAWSPDGARLATGSRDGTVKVWDAAGGRERLTLRGHDGPVWSISWSPDGARLAAGTGDGTANVWDAAGGRDPLTLEGHTGPVLSVAWSPDGRRLATGSQDDTSRIWDAAGGRERLTLAGHASRAWAVAGLSGVLCVCWSPDGARLATGSGDGTAKIWLASDGRERLTLKSSTGPVRSVAWSPDGARLATGYQDGTATVWDAAGGRERLILRGHTNAVTGISWSPDGARLATASWDHSARVWEAAGGPESLVFRGHTDAVTAVSWSPDGRRLATASDDGTARVWEAAGGRDPLTLEGHNGLVLSVSWSPDGQRLATASDDGTARVWPAVGGRERLILRGHAGQVLSASWSPDGARLATGGDDGTARVWDAADGRGRFTFAGHAAAALPVCWSPDGRRLATGSWDHTAKVWDVSGGREPLTLAGHTDAVCAICWSPDGARLATGSHDGTARVWDAAGGRHRLTLEASIGWVRSVCWSPDGARLATGGDDNTARVWDATGGQRLVLRGHTNAITAVSWSPDGARLATGSRDGTAKVWDAAGGRELLTLKGHTGGVWSVSWSPDGARLATGSLDGTAKVWDAADAEAVRGWVRQDRAVRDLLDRNDIWGPQVRGFLQDWLLLLPLPFATGETGAQALDRPQLPGEAQSRPRDGELVLVGGRPWRWQAHRSRNAIVNFNAAAGRVAERSVAYAVCYIESDRARDGLWLQVGSDDQARVYLNGRPIYRVRLPRALWTVDTVGPVGLERGTNVLLFKVVNEATGWEGCARLVDDAGHPVQGLRVRLTP